MTGFCACGCGSTPPIAKRTRPKLGHVAGQPTKYVHGHGPRTGCGADLVFTGERWYVAGRDGHRYLWYRVLMENEIGRPLRRDELVHHINGDPTDDRIENLQVVSRREHVLIHIAQGDHPGFTDEARRNSRLATTNRVGLVCTQCGGAFTRPASHVKSGRTFCSKSCQYTWRTGVPRARWAA